jgi:ferredoxin-thioredoxin reductase catalytic chain
MNEREEKILERSREDAEKNRFFLCPDAGLLNDLIVGLAVNETKHGYASCPCRLATGNAAFDSDIVCPCEYRDADCAEFGSCYCGLYVSREVYETPSKLKAIPERRPKEITERTFQPQTSALKEAPVETSQSKGTKVNKNIPVWRCTVCGYLAAREYPPAICPICKAKSERFERFDFG